MGGRGGGGRLDITKSILTDADHHILRLVISILFTGPKIIIKKPVEFLAR